MEPFLCDAQLVCGVTKLQSHPGDHVAPGGLVPGQRNSHQWADDEEGDECRAVFGTACFQTEVVCNKEVPGGRRGTWNVLRQTPQRCGDP